MPISAALVETASSPVVLKSWNEKISEALPEPLFEEEMQVLLANFLFIVIILQSLPTYAHVWSVYRTRTHEGILMWTVIVQIVLSVGWILYGLFVVKNFLVVVSAAILLLGNVLLALALRDARADSDEIETG